MDRVELLICAALASIVALTAAVLSVHRHDRTDWYAVWERPGHWSTAGVDVARDEVTNFFSVDYRHIDQQIEATLRLATGTFAERYAERRAQLASSVRQSRAIWTPSLTADETAVEFVEPDVASVLVAADVAERGAGRTAVIARQRVRVTLAYTDGTWLVSGFEVLT